MKAHGLASSLSEQTANSHAILGPDNFPQALVVSPGKQLRWFKIRRSTLLLSIYWTAIFVATHLPKSSLPSVEVSDKLVHFGAYATLSLLLCLRLRSQRVLPLPRALMSAFLIGVLYGILDELTQQIIPGREADWWDLCADTVGLAIGCAVYYVLHLMSLRVAWLAALESVLQAPVKGVDTDRQQDDPVQ